ncbi:Cd2+/Zn2+-exporting ATPase [Kroppenstedtia sanguinis]|uniref:heavy metal translocating P-type ATPase n=1 Tax=Kroppenstedtia sanguinis TaxID=1380684 RepID=UPI003D1CB0E4
MSEGEAGVQSEVAVVYRLTGLTCADCAAKFEQEVKKAPGVSDARVNFGASKLTIWGEELSREHVNRLGAFDGIRVKEEPGEDGQVLPWYRERQVLFTGGSLLLILFALGAKGVDAPQPLVTGLFLAAVITGGWETARKGLPGLIRLRFDMNALMTVAVAGAIGIGYWDEAAVVAFLFGVSETLQIYTSGKARSSLRALLDLAPRKARIRRQGEALILPVEEVEVGDILLLRPGEKLAMDGRITVGVSSINQAAITGESVPVPKETGDEVFAGTLNGEGFLEVEVTKRAEETTLSKIISMVEEAQEKRAPVQAFVDRFAKIYTPVILLFSLSVFLIKPLVFGVAWTGALYDALALLIVACPCALVVSTPMAMVSAIGNAARNGVLIKGGIHLETVGALDVVAFDKTGTLTRGEPVVKEVVPFHGADRNQVLAIAAGMESMSEHPLAQAVVHMAEAEGIVPADVKEFQAQPGRGAEAVVDGRLHRIGSPRWILPEDISGEIRERMESLEDRGYTVVCLDAPDRLLAVFALADEVRDTSREAVQVLKQAGMHPVMLTGDHHRTARAIAAEVGIDDYRGELLPQDKLEAVQELKSSRGRIAMVGDGINDAPAMAAADTGIAMGGAGTDTALETSDIVLMADDLAKLPFTIRLSRAARGIIRQNITLSLLAKFLAVFFVFPGWLTLWLAIFADMGATILVTLNSIRLLKINP